MASPTFRRHRLGLTVLLARASISTRSFMYRVDTNASSSSNGTAKDSTEFWYYITVSSLLVLAGGVFAGYFSFLFFKSSYNCQHGKFMIFRLQPDSRFDGA